MEKDQKRRAQKFCQAFCLVVVLLGWGKELFLPASSRITTNENIKDTLVAEVVAEDSVTIEKLTVVDSVVVEKEEVSADDNDDFIPHRIFSVPGFKNTFPDQNDVQLIAAEKNGIKPLELRSDVKKNYDKLVYIGSNPFFYVEKMKQGAPYLVPKAALLVEDIGRTFLDSLQIKGIPLHKIIVTSALRTNEDIGHLQRRNLNSVQNSCHSYATTVDIAYNRYKTVQAPDGPSRREVQNDSLKWVLSEVLNDFRQQGRCYVKYEVKQSCYHLTVR